MANKNKAALIKPGIIILAAIMIMYLFLGPALTYAGGLAIRFYLIGATRYLGTIPLWQYLIFWIIDLALIGLIGWFVFKSHIKDLYKAIYLGLPLVYFNIAGGYTIIGLEFMKNPLGAVLIMVALNLIILAAIIWFVQKFQLIWYYYLAGIPNLVIYLYLLFMYLVFGGTS